MNYLLKQIFSFFQRKDDARAVDACLVLVITNILKNSGAPFFEQYCIN